MSSQNNGEGKTAEIPELIGIQVTKEPFVPAEKTLIRKWGKILNTAQEGSAWGYIVLQSFRNHKNGLAWPSYRTLHEITGYSVPKWVRIVANLVKYGLIILVRVPDKQNNFYRIPPLPDLPDLPPDTVEEEEQQEPQPTPKVFNETTLDSAVAAGQKRLQQGAQRRLVSLVAGNPDIAKWSCNTFLNYFSAYFRSKLQLPEKRATVVARDRANWKNMIENYAPKSVKNALEFAIDNWENIEYMHEPPTPAMVFRHRSRLISDMIGHSDDIGHTDDEVGIGNRK